MPTYDYECKSCGHSFEAFQSIMDPPLKKCPECGKAVRRLIGGGAGIIFKGSGFYVTDSRRSSSTKKTSTSKSDSNSAVASGGSSDSSSNSSAPSNSNSSSDKSSSTPSNASTKSSD